MLLQEEFRLKNNVKEGIKSLTDELESTQVALVKVSGVPLDQLDPNFKIHHGISDNIKDIESQVKKVKERYDRYNVHRVVANLVATTVDPRHLAMYNKVSDLVGIDEGANELMNNLFEAGDEPTKKIKTFSIVRFGGLGKTTLVKAVYDKVKKDFDCSAFVSIGLKCDPDKVFKDVIYDLDKQNHENIIVSEMDEKQLIDKLREFLADKRYTSYFMEILDSEHQALSNFLKYSKA
ncbi:putative disease resistance protein [Zea mays]|uniref:Putative disease resistance protein n=1 Tax=Zea mays TaxID=4577 RepID=A0A3L6G7Y0_MAIZE|nr:putative disease resistance protein [Zea mays]